MKFDDSRPDYYTDDEPEENSATGETPRKITFEEMTGGASADVDGVSGVSTVEENPHRRHLWRKVLLWIVGIAVLVLGIVVYLRYFNPIVVDGQMKCYVINVEKRGVVFKTYEADVVSESAITDPSRLYSREHSISIDNELLAKELQAVQGTGRPVTLRYKTYCATVPWRGASKSVVTSIINN